MAEKKFKAPGRGPWLSMREASARLGISPGALRAWADNGRVGSFRTPGGHRRFSASDLARLAPAPTPGASSLRVLAHAALGRTRFEVSEGKLQNEEWYQHCPAGAREDHRALGRRVLVTLGQVLSGEGEDVDLDRARELGQSYGQVNRKHGLALTDALSACLFFRDRFFDSLLELAETTPALDALGPLRRVSRFFDAMILAMAEQYARAPGKKR